MLTNSTITAYSYNHVILIGLSWPINNSMLYGFIDSINCISLGYRKPTPVTMPSKAMVCSRLTPVIASSKLAEGMGIRLFCLLCVVHVAAPATS